MDENKNTPSHESSEIQPDSTAHDSVSSKLSNEAFESLRSAFINSTDNKSLAKTSSDSSAVLSAADRNALTSQLAHKIASEQKSTINQGSNSALDSFLRNDKKLPDLSIIGLDTMLAPKKPGTGGGGGQGGGKGTH